VGVLCYLCYLIVGVLYSLNEGEGRWWFAPDTVNTLVALQSFDHAGRGTRGVHTFVLSQPPFSGRHYSNAMRLNKFISESGLCSRREADELISQQRVLLNGEIAETGAKWREGMAVLVDGHIVKQKPTAKNKRKHVYIALNKPVGITCTTDESVDGNIVNFVDHRERIFPVGRLDKNSEGLILLTSNGDIVNQILRSENKHEKEYLVGVNKPVNDVFLRAMARGVRIHNQVTLPCKVSRLAKYGFRIVLTQGLNRQIRLMCEQLGYKVVQLRRTRIMNVKLGSLKPGIWRNLTDVELSGLLPDHKDW